MKYIILIIAFASSFNSFGQLTDDKIYELAAKEADRYAMILSLNSTTEKAMTNILAEYDRNRSNGIIEPSRYRVEVEKLKAERESKLENLLGERGYRNYKMLQEIDRSAEEEYYEDISGAMSQDQEMLSEITAYFLDDVFPVMSHYRASLDTSFTETDLRAINAIKDSIYNNILIEPGVDSLHFVKPLSPTLYYEMLGYAQKYEEAHVTLMSKLDLFNKEWKSVFGEIVSDYYSESQLEALSQANQSLAKKGILTVLDRLSFFLIEPGDKNKYFKNVRLINMMKKYLIYTE